MDGFFNQYYSPEQQYPYQPQAPEQSYQQQFLPQPKYQQQSNQGSWAYQCPSACQSQNYGYSSYEPQHYEGCPNPSAYQDYGVHTQRVDSFTQIQPLDQSLAWQEAYYSPPMNQSQYDQFPPIPQEDFTDIQIERINFLLNESLIQMKKDMQEFDRRFDSDVKNLEDRMGQLIEKRRHEKEEETCAIAVVRDDDVITEKVQVESEVDDSVCHDEISEPDSELGLLIVPPPIAIFDYGKFHVLPIASSPLKMKIDDTLVECVVEPTIVMTEQEFFGDEDSSFWDEEELQDLEMEEVQLLSITLSPDEIRNDDLEGCTIDLSTLFDETQLESEEKLGSPISPSLPIEVNEDVVMKSEVKSYETEEPFMVELPGEVEIISMPVPDYYTLPPCVDEYYAIDFAYLPVDGAHRICKKKQLPCNGNYKKKVMRDFDKRGFPSWEEVTSRAMRGKFLANSVSVMLAIFSLLELLVFLNSDFG